MSAAAAPSTAASGAALPGLSRHVTQDVIDAYARASGDFNPIHVDPAFAARGPFGRTIAHGLMTLALVAEMLNAWSGGAFDAAGELDVAFVGPVFAGDLVEVGGSVDEVAAEGGRRVATVSLACRAGDRPVLAGTARVPLDPP